MLNQRSTEKGRQASGLFIHSHVYTRFYGKPKAVWDLFERLLSM